MAYHPTAALSFGQPLPSYPVTPGSSLDPATAVKAMAAGASIHVDTQEQAEAILRAVGLTDNEVAFRMRVAYADWDNEDDMLAGLPLEATDGAATL